MQQAAQRAYDRIVPRLDPLFKGKAKPLKDQFTHRLTTLFEEIYDLLIKIYPQPDFYYHLEQILSTAAAAYLERPNDLHRLDAQREADPVWFQSEKMMGAVCYVDLFAGDLKGLRKKIPYFKELGLTYLHLMPLFKAPEPNSDGGYAVSSYREVNPKLGTMRQLQQLAADLREIGVSLCLDFVFNHTSDEHTWAQQAIAGDPDYRAFYWVFPDRKLPDQYEKTLREIFPDQAPGSFTYHPQMKQWVWTTFNTFQWDLNYHNPAVFNAMLGEMLFLANMGVEVLRMDAVAFIWKAMGTSCEGLPPAHWILQAFNALVRLVAPAMIFKSEAIVHPAEVEKYFGLGQKAGYECPISYNPTLMALLWEALATRETKLLQRSMIKRFPHPANCAWVNYVRVHDDIGWSFADEDAAEVWIKGFDHRQFLNAFYSGEFRGSFARGERFNFNPLTLDARISGTCASLAGLESALADHDETQIEWAIRRMVLIHSIILSIGGIPLLYLGDEIGTLNDYSYRLDPGKAGDNRWMHRPAADWKKYAQRENPASIAGRIFQPLLHLIQLRQRSPVFAGGQTTFIETGNRHLLGYLRGNAQQRVLVLANFSEREQAVNVTLKPFREKGQDWITGETVKINKSLLPYQVRWLGV